jgi:hypothetical protein
VKLPLHLLEARLRNEDCVLTIEQFVREPNKFVDQVIADPNVAVRFAQLLPMMTPKQKGVVSV